MKFSPVGTAENLRLFQSSLRDYSSFKSYPGLHGLTSVRPVQIGVERCLGSAIALSLALPSPFCHPERSRGICGAPFVCPTPAGPQPPPIITESLMETPTSPLSCRVSRSGPRNRRSLGFARDDKKERAVPRKGRLLNRGIFQNEFGQV